MPLVRVDCHRALADRRPALSEAIHRALVDSLGMPADDLFQVFSLHDPGDLYYSPTFPDADRSDIVFVQVLLARMYDGPTKQEMGAAIARELAGAGVKADDVLVACTENDGPDWYAPSRAFAAEVAR